ncbi:hypothetical protein CHUAL_001663 [Chamberlinius hualienensis]
MSNNMGAPSSPCHPPPFAISATQPTPLAHVILDCHYFSQDPSIAATRIVMANRYHPLTVNSLRTEQSKNTIATNLLYI